MVSLLSSPEIHLSGRIIWNETERYFDPYP